MHCRKRREFYVNPYAWHVSCQVHVVWYPRSYSSYWCPACLFWLSVIDATDADGVRMHIGSIWLYVVMLTCCLLIWWRWAFCFFYAWLTFWSWSASVFLFFGPCCFWSLKPESAPTSLEKGDVFRESETFILAHGFQKETTSFRGKKHEAHPFLASTVKVRFESWMLFCSRPVLIIAERASVWIFLAPIMLYDIYALTFIASRT